MFVVVLGLVIWGLIVAMKNPPTPGSTLGTPPSITLADHARGPDDAAVTLIEYSDFECPACAAYYPLIEKLLNESSTTIRFVYRHYPLYPQPHQNSFIAAQAAEAADKQGRFWDMYRKLFENQTVWTGSKSAVTLFESYAKEIGLNVETYKKDFDSLRPKPAYSVIATRERLLGSPARRHFS